MEMEVVVGGRSPVSKKLSFVGVFDMFETDGWEKAKRLSIKSVFRTTSRNKGM